MVNKTANSKYIKKLNRMTILNVIKENQPIGRQAVAQITGLTPPAITGIIRELIDLGFVEEVGLGRSNGGRRPMELTFNSKAAFVAGIEVTNSETIIGIADLANPPDDINTYALDMSEPVQGFPALVKLVKTVLKSAPNKDRKIIGIGLAFPGLVQAQAGIVRRSINLGASWNNFPIREALEKELDMPVFTENNSNAGVLAERWFGGGTDCQDLVYVNLGEGISAGILLGGRLLQGFQGYAGEMGHITVQEGGVLCNCGNRGCLEAICSTRALVRQANSEMPIIADTDPLKKIWLTKGKVGIDDILTAFLPDTYSWYLMEQTAKYVALIVADIINFYNPQAIFLGGKLSANMRHFQELIYGIVTTHAFPEIVNSTRIEISNLGVKSAVTGACALAARELLKSSQSVLLDVAAETNNSQSHNLLG